MKRALEEVIAELRALAAGLEEELQPGEGPDAAANEAEEAAAASTTASLLGRVRRKARSADEFVHESP